MPTAYLALAEIREGIDRDDLVVANLVPSAILDLLAERGDCSLGHGPLASGGVIHIVEHIEREPSENCR
ncbi:hypothetical protein [Novosphingobium sp.]|uniref:hypothetical protein n=1 Tax=Novosphingobium sp. TaxID=1874826 RepID=UPI003D6D6C7D